MNTKVKIGRRNFTTLVSATRRHNLPPATIALIESGKFRSRAQKINVVAISPQDRLQLLWCLDQLHSPDSPSAQVIVASILINRMIYNIKEANKMLFGKIRIVDIERGQDRVWRALMDVGMIRSYETPSYGTTFNGIIPPGFPKKLREFREKLSQVSPPLSQQDIEMVISLAKDGYKSEREKSKERLMEKVKSTLEAHQAPFKDSAAFQVPAAPVTKKQANISWDNSWIAPYELARTLGLFIEMKKANSRVGHSDCFRTAGCEAIEPLFLHSVVTDKYLIINNHFVFKFRGDSLALYLGPNRDGFVFGAICEPDQREVDIIHQQAGYLRSRNPIFIPDFHPSIVRHSEVCAIGGSTLFALTLDKFYRQMTTLASG